MPTLDQQIMSDLESMLKELLKNPDGGMRMLELATALFNRGHFEAAAKAETAALALRDPKVTHRWRRRQARRAPANQFLLLRSQERNIAFWNAIRKNISPGDLVLEIGTGSGILAMMAAKAGAGRVITCERQPFMASVAEEIVRHNGFESHISVLAKDLDEVEIGIDLPEKADLLISDLFTGSLLDAGGLRLIHRARQHLTKDSARVIPARATLYGRLVGGSELERLCRIDNAAGFDLSQFNVFSPPVIPIQPERFSQLVYRTYSEPVDCFTFDFNSLHGFGSRNRSIQIRTTNDGVVLGFLQWLQLDLGAEIQIEAAEHSTINWPRFLHVFPSRFNVKSDETIGLEIEHDWNSFSVWPAES